MAKPLVSSRIVDSRWFSRCISALALAIFCSSFAAGDDHLSRRNILPIPTVHEQAGPAAFQTSTFRRSYLLAAGLLCSFQMSFFIELLSQRERRDSIIGSLAFFDSSHREAWPDDLSKQVKVLAPNALARHASEEIPLDLSERLINAQEQERARIASELHDDMGQRLAVIAIEVELARQSLPAGEAECRNRLTRVANIANELSADVRDLSHRLHSSMLEHVGLVAAVRDLCGEIGRRHGVYIHVSDRDVEPSIPPEVSLCLYRIVQECLSNILKHSGCEAAEIEIFGGAGTLRLRVKDNGVGFDPERRGAGFGLVSMKERLRILNGQLKVRSRPLDGTEIMAEVPLTVIHLNRAISMRAG